MGYQPDLFEMEEQIHTTPKPKNNKNKKKQKQNGKGRRRNKLFAAIYDWWNAEPEEPDEEEIEKNLREKA